MFILSRYWPWKEDHFMTKKLSKSAASNTDDFIELGMTLTKLLEENDTAYANCIAENGVGPRKAYYLISLYKAFASLCVPKARLLSIGWSKLSLLAPVVSEATVDYWLVQAENLTSVELKELINGKTPHLNKHCVLYYLTPDEFDRLANVSVKFGAVLEGRSIVGKEAALMLALSDLV
jgi:hypothetical protein